MKNQDSINVRVEEVQGPSTQGAAAPSAAFSWMRLAVVSAVAAILCSCAGTQAMKKPDLSKVAVDTPYIEAKALKNPRYIVDVTQGRWRGGKMLIFEWDLPGDDIHNRMYSYAVIKDGRVVSLYEDPADKYRKDPVAASQALLDTQAEKGLRSAGQQRTAQAALQGVSTGLSAVGSFVPLAGPALAAAGQAVGTATQIASAAAPASTSPAATTTNPGAAGLPPYVATTPSAIKAGSRN
jgi:hypothetical protein